MKLWIKRSLIGLFGATIVLGGLTACGHRHGGHGMAMSEEDSAKFKARMVERVGKELELNEQQKQRLATLGDRLRDQRLALVGKTMTVVGGTGLGDAAVVTAYDAQTNVYTLNRALPTTLDSSSRLRAIAHASAKPS